MGKALPLFALALVLGRGAASRGAPDAAYPGITLTKLAFGSCSKQVGLCIRRRVAYVIMGSNHYSGPDESRPRSGAKLRTWPRKAPD
jgi:hypothetical protein